MKDVVIESGRKWLHIPWREIVEYRDLLTTMVSRDFVAKYKQTVLGPVWFVIQPLVTTLVFTLVFGKVAKIPTDALPPLLFYLCGNLAWGYFSQCFGATSTTFASNASLFGKVYFPRLIVPLSKAVSGLLGLAIQMATFLVFWLYFKFFTAAGAHIHMRATAAMLPALILLSAMVGLGAGFWMSALTAKYRDFVFISGFLSQLWMYATPVIYPLSVVPEKWRWVCALNPMTGVVELYRHALLGTGTVTPLYLASSAATGLVLILSGILVFNRTERTFIDTV